MIAYLSKSNASKALIDRQKVIITEDTVRQALRLDDAKSIDCLPNEEKFAELARMGYEKPSIKLTFYKAFFLAQWKFLIHIILQCMSPKRTTWIDDKCSNLLISPPILPNIHPLPHTKVFPNMRRVGKGFSRENTPLFEGMFVPQQAHDDVDANDIIDVVVDATTKAENVAEPTLPTPANTPPPPQELPSTS
uniref:Synaptobrevin, longin-like domain protein n=1 Tax=Tanacetum cinerariifolium TaxID=118510 RepID=A0A699KUH3_TANCI|nr:hypothetical protein [Tanacetum cinerariifolium]